MQGWVAARSDAPCMCMCARGRGNALFEHAFRSLPPDGGWGRRGTGVRCVSDANGAHITIDACDWARIKWPCRTTWGGGKKRTAGRHGRERRRGPPWRDRATLPLCWLTAVSVTSDTLSQTLRVFGELMRNSGQITELCFAMQPGLAERPQRRPCAWIVRVPPYIRGRGGEGGGPQTPGTLGSPPDPRRPGPSGHQQHVPCRGWRDTTHTGGWYQGCLRLK